MNKSNPLRTALLSNAAFSVLSATVFLIAANPLAKLMHLPYPLVLQVIGGGLVVFVGLLLWVAKHQRPFWVRTVIIMDATWVVGSAVVLVWDPVGFSIWGIGLILGIALVVAGLALWQWRALN
jgi:hypothetical protein